MPALTDHQLPLVQTRGTHSLHACMFSCACILRALMHISTHIGVCVCVCVCVCAPSHINCAECDISLLFLPFPCYSPSVLPLLPPPPPLFPPPPPSPPPSPAPSLRSSRKCPRTVTSTVMCPEKPFRFRRTGRSCAKTRVQSGVEKVSVLRACVCARLSEVGERKRGKREREKEISMRACECVWT